MIEVKFIGRGGQGAVIASQILAKVYFHMGKYPQCYSLFGGERRGAPVASFLRVDEEKILLKCEIKRPDQIIYMAADLIDEKEIMANLKPGGTIIINNALTRDGFASLRKFRIALVNALSVSEDSGLGSTINTAILGAYCRANPDVPFTFLETAIRETVPARIEENVAAAKRAFDVTELREGVQS
ncbi:MAG TPA: 2-oxoacid:acceptor oxidoreductase family protein [Syntrophorhabdaceae bacterium]|jgi:2-oxoacid:acceptor oxidoreductase gamma subunit (pyruvate/2-ketoisovalerate family)